MLALFSPLNVRPQLVAKRLQTMPAELYSGWFGSVAELYMECCLDPAEQARFVSFLRTGAQQLELRLGDPTLAYFSGSYINYAADKAFKAAINPAMSSILAPILQQPVGGLSRCLGGGRGVLQRRWRSCQPGVKRVAVVTGLWTAGHPVYRGYEAAVRALAEAGFKVTLVHLGPASSVVEAGAPFDEATVP